MSDDMKKLIEAELRQQLAEANERIENLRHEAEEVAAETLTRLNLLESRLAAVTAERDELQAKRDTEWAQFVRIAREWYRATLDAGKEGR